LSKLPKIDLLIGGSPCQDISRSQVNEGNEGIFDSRSGLFFEYLRIRNWIIKNNNPNLLWLLENVKPRKKEYLSIMS
jgi:site-specific DNA-cytosine methylase